MRDRIPLVHYTRKNGVLYAICLVWPGKTLTLETCLPAPKTTVRMVGVGSVPWKRADQGMIIEVPVLSVAELPCRHAWVFAIDGLGNFE